MAVAHYIPFRAIRAGAVFKNYIEMGIKHSSSIIYSILKFYSYFNLIHYLYSMIHFIHNFF